MNFEEIAKIIQYHRKRAGLSRIELADLAGVGKTVVYDIEHGKATIQFQSLAKVLETLNISINLISPLMSEYEQVKAEIEEKENSVKELQNEQ